MVQGNKCVWRRIGLGIACLVGGILPVVGLTLVQGGDDYAREPILYYTSIPTDPVAQLQKKIDAGEVRLEHDPQHGYLPAVLRALHIPVASQMLVFSKTSFQRDHISPQTPRALYFNDNVYVGWVQDGTVVELSTADPQLGAVFYTLSQEKGGTPKFRRQTHECLQCHSSVFSKAIPGHIMRSVYSDRSGQPMLSQGSHLTTDESPMQERWGGWYVTGQLGAQPHLGNRVFRNEAEVESRREAGGVNITDLKKQVDTSPYLNRHSDAVALLILAHQTGMHNLITQAGYGTRMALHYEAMLNKELGRPPDYRADSTRSRITSVCEPLLKAMLFGDEAPLEGPVTGTSGFAGWFRSQGPRDTKGRSLRELDLKRRLFRYPCSFLIYSDAFLSLPVPAKEYLYGRLWDVLSGKDTSKPVAHLQQADCKAILEILTDTHSEFAAWKAKQPSLDVSHK